MLHDFNTEFSEPTPGTGVLTRRVRSFIESGTMTYLLGGAGPDGFAQVSFRPSVWADEPVGYLEELYVVPDRRGESVGRAIMGAVLELARERGAAGMEVVTGENDTAARALYERRLRQRDRGRGEGPVALLRAQLLRRDCGLARGGSAGPPPAVSRPRAR